MDDFGSHYSNLAVLIQYDFDSAKIDRSMVTEITNNRKSRILLDYMTSMINDLGNSLYRRGNRDKRAGRYFKENKGRDDPGILLWKTCAKKEKFYEAFIAE